MHCLRIAMAQINTIVGDFNVNEYKISENIKAARSLGVDLITFPELSICGYPPEDLLFKQQFIEENLQSLAKVAEGSSGMTVVVGFVENKENIYNAAAVIHDGRLVGVYHKIYLPNYGVFEERKYFSPGKQVPVFKIYDFSVAVFICNDLWHPSLPYLGVCQKADIFLTMMKTAY